MSVYVELSSPTSVGAFVRKIKDMGIKMTDMELYKDADFGKASVSASLSLSKRRSHEEILAEIGSLEDITYIEEI